MQEETIQNNPNSAMLKEVAKINSERRGQATGQDEELPKGASQVEESEETPELQAEASEETSQEAQGESEDSEGGEPEKAEAPIRIGGREFKSQEEAFRWAEEQERERLLSEAHAQGVREALEAQRAQTAVQQEEPEDNFEEQFYANPKEALEKIQTRARDEAVAMIKAEQNKERTWSEFLNEYPDIRRKDAERVLNENWDTLGKITDLKVGMKELARKVRSEYEEIYSLTRPKTQLAAKKQTINASGGASSGVTPQKKDDRPLSFAEQLRRMKG